MREMGYMAGGDEQPEEDNHGSTQQVFHQSKDMLCSEQKFWLQIKSQKMFWPKFMTHKHTHQGREREGERKR